MEISGKIKGTSEDFQRIHIWSAICWISCGNAWNPYGKLEESRRKSKDSFGKSMKSARKSKECWGKSMDPLRKSTWTPCESHCRLVKEICMGSLWEPTWDPLRTSMWVPWGNQCGFFKYINVDSSRKSVGTARGNQWGFLKIVNRDSLKKSRGIPWRKPRVSLRKSTIITLGFLKELLWNQWGFLEELNGEPSRTPTIINGDSLKDSTATL